MNSQAIQAPSANITLPLNQAVQASNGAQFALMVSLLFEARLERPTVEGGFAASTLVAPELGKGRQNFNLEVSLNLALQNNQIHQFNLLRSLYAERIISARAAVINGLDNNSESIADEVLSQIQQGYQPGNASLSREAKKISLASTSFAA